MKLFKNDNEFNKTLADYRAARKAQDTALTALMVNSIVHIWQGDGNTNWLKSILDALQHDDKTLFNDFRRAVGFIMKPPEGKSPLTITTTGKDGIKIDAKGWNKFPCPIEMNEDGEPVALVNEKPIEHWRDFIPKAESKGDVLSPLNLEKTQERTIKALTKDLEKSGLNIPSLVADIEHVFAKYRKQIEAKHAALMKQQREALTSLSSAFDDENHGESVTALPQSNVA